MDLNHAKIGKIREELQINNDLERKSMGHRTGSIRSIDESLSLSGNQDLLRTVVCGNVGDGKSTLVNFLLQDLQESKDSHPVMRKHGTTFGGNCRYFATAQRSFLITDTLGEAQLAHQTVTGSLVAYSAILLVDARNGLLTQTRSHALLLSLLGIPHVALVINKMDLVGFDVDAFQNIAVQFESVARLVGGASVIAIPLCALNGDNVVTHSAHTPWYEGPTLSEFLEAALPTRRRDERLVIPVQKVHYPQTGFDFRGYRGTVATGRVRVGDEIRMTSSGKRAHVSEMIGLDGPLDEAVAGASVTLRLDREVDVTGGDVMACANTPLETTDQFEATLVWMANDAGMTGRTYELLLATQRVTASITTIKYRINTDTLAHEPARALHLNEIAVCNLALDRPVAFTVYAQTPELGTFVLLDCLNHEVVAKGVIRHSLRRAHNIHRQEVSIARQDRERLNNHAGKVVWFTGLSGAGKSTLANALECELHSRGLRTYLLDGDNIRHGLNKDLGFTDSDRVENIRRIAEVARLMLDAGLIVLTAFISPFCREREMARNLVGVENFLEVYVSTPLEVCEQRDVKGLYKKARSGELPNLTGLSSPYEAPESPGFVADCSAQSIEQVVSGLVRLIAP